MSEYFKYIFDGTEILFSSAGNIEIHRIKSMDTKKELKIARNIRKKTNALDRSTKRIKKIVIEALS